MILKTDDEFPAAGEKCSWCEKTLGSHDFVSHTVCKSCYTLLHRANISDQEIFDSSGEKKESH